MSGLLVPLGFPTVNAGGTEGLGVGVRTDNLTLVAPNGTSGTRAQIAADIAAVLAGGGQNVFGLQGNTR
jgi:hypothetical protein